MVALATQSNIIPFPSCSQDAPTPQGNNEWYYEMACRAALWYNRSRNIDVLGGAVNTPNRIKLIRSFIMESIPHSVEERNSSYTKHRTGPMARPLAERFWEKVMQGNSDECWEWQSCTYRRGYGKFSLTRCNAVYAHRIAYELAHGAIPAGLYVCHTCDNPRCCNPHHLFAGTQKDNMQDCKNKGRSSPPPHNKRKAAL